MFVLENTAWLSTFIKISLYNLEKKYMQCILVCFLESMKLVKFGKMKYCFMHHYNGNALIFRLAYDIKS